MRNTQREFFRDVEAAKAEESADDFRVISLHQPWATLVAIQAKGYETRSWKTDYRGLVGIHASKTWEEDEMALVMEEPFARVLTLAGYKKPRELVELGGHIIAVATLTDVTRMTLPFIEAVKAEDPNEIAFGAWTADEERYAWKLDNVKKLETPIPHRGMQGLYRWAEGSKLFGTRNSA